MGEERVKEREALRGGGGGEVGQWKGREPMEKSSDPAIVKHDSKVWRWVEFVEEEYRNEGPNPAATITSGSQQETKSKVINRPIQQRLAAFFQRSGPDHAERILHCKNPPAASFNLQLLPPTTAPASTAFLPPQQPRLQPPNLKDDPWQLPSKALQVISFTIQY
ncbi:hypothetical protein HPP92_024227 [Vanilla planifolia]|uniref:Uncharacterized protein n=1 Tax=Vanilla planifolia TaxID=51239 RepID=A0A835PM29_VANPL|nr:hypothetical protein HPP92_024227 [Vanilla planifolia]